MPKFIEQMTTENVTEISNLSMYITKAFEIRKKTLTLIKYSPSRFHVYRWYVDWRFYLYWM